MSGDIYRPHLLATQPPDSHYDKNSMAQGQEDNQHEGIKKSKHNFAEKENNIGSQVVERLGNRAINQKVAGSIPRAVTNYVVSLGKALHPTCLGECPCTYSKSFWIRASAKWLNVNKFLCQCNTIINNNL